VEPRFLVEPRHQNRPGDTCARGACDGYGDRLEPDEHNVTVQIYFSDPSINLEFPSPKATLLGEGVISLPASGTNVFSTTWSVPLMPNAVGEHHWCIGVVIKHPDDLPLSTQALYSSNVAHHNFAPIETLSTAQALRFVVDNDSTIAKNLDVFVSTEQLPSRWDVRLDPKRPKMLAPGERYVGFAQVLVPPGASAAEGFISIQGALTARRSGVVAPTGSGIAYRVKYVPPVDVLGPWWWGVIPNILLLVMLLVLVVLIAILIVILRRLRPT
jgi:hypothetical protein